MRCTVPQQVDDMSLKDLFDQVSQHPKIVAVSLFACLVVGSVGAVFYLKVSEARIAVLDERMRSQEDASKRQKHINRLVQQQVSALHKGFEGLPPAVFDIRRAVTEPGSRGVPAHVRMKLITQIELLEGQLTVLQSAIANSEALSKSLDTLVAGIKAEENNDYSAAARLYAQAAETGVVEAQARLGRLYREGHGVQSELDIAARLLESSALRGSLSAKDDAVDIYLTSNRYENPKVRAAALLSIEPSSQVQKARLESLSRHFSHSEIDALEKQIAELRKAQAELVKSAADLKDEGDTGPRR